MLLGHDGRNRHAPLCPRSQLSRDLCTQPLPRHRAGHDVARGDDKGEAGGHHAPAQIRPDPRTARRPSQDDDERADKAQHRSHGLGRTRPTPRQDDEQAHHRPPVRCAPHRLKHDLHNRYEAAAQRHPHSRYPWLSHRVYPEHSAHLEHP